MEFPSLWRMKEGAWRRALKVCEKIAAKDRSSLFLVSQYFCDRRRYEAFLATYAVMRVIDDFVDAVPDIRALSSVELAQRVKGLSTWRKRIQAMYAGKPLPRSLDRALAAILPSFPIPFEIWSRFLDAMAYDLNHDRFMTSRDFLAYAEGAAAAPTIVYVFLLCAQAEPRVRPGEFCFQIRQMGDGFDYQVCGRALGVFAYIAHILRDLKADLSSGKQGRIYIAISDLTEAGLSEAEFCSMVRSGRGDERWSSLVNILCRRAHSFEEQGVRMARARFRAMDPDCRFILALIIRVYQSLLQRIEANPQAILAGEIIQNESDRRALTYEVAAEFGFPGRVDRKPSCGGP